MTASVPVDVVIFGGGAAGLWLLDECVRAGYCAVLLEAHELGSGQTIASQGILHGGLKYTLSGLLTPSARAISAMPAIWRKCLAGEARPNLSATRLRAPHCYLWRTASLMSRLGMIGAKAGLQVGPVEVSKEERPAALRECPGTVARLDEQVIDPASFITDLSWQHRLRIARIDVSHGLECVCGSAGDVTTLRLIDPESGKPLDVRPRRVVLTAGAGNETLREMMGRREHVMQRRPLHMVMVRGAEQSLPLLNGHCVDGARTRVTVTTAQDVAGRRVWQVGGQVSEDGVAMDERTLVEHARKELRAALPGVDLNGGGIEWATYRVDRAEFASGGKRPENAAVLCEGNVITVWPTKLVLAPALFSQVRAHLHEPAMDDHAAVHAMTDWTRPVVALPPWETGRTWFDAH